MNKIVSSLVNILLDKGLIDLPNIVIKKHLIKHFLNFEISLNGFIKDFVYNKLFRILNNQSFYADVETEADSAQYGEIENFFV